MNKLQIKMNGIKGELYLSGPQYSFHDETLLVLFYFVSFVGLVLNFLLNLFFFSLGGGVTRAEGEHKGLER